MLLSFFEEIYHVGRFTA